MLYCFHTQYRCRWRLRPKLRHLGIKRVWFCKRLDKLDVLLPYTVSMQMEAQTKIQTSSCKKSPVLSKIRQAWCTASIHSIDVDGGSDQKLRHLAIKRVRFCQRLDKHGVLLPYTVSMQMEAQTKIKTSSYLKSGFVKDQTSMVYCSRIHSIDVDGG